MMALHSAESVLKKNPVMLTCHITGSSDFQQLDFVDLYCTDSGVSTAAYGSDFAVKYR